MWDKCLYKSSLIQSIIIILLGSTKGQFVKLCLIGSQMRKPQHLLRWGLFHLFSLSLCHLLYLLIGWCYTSFFPVIHVFAIYYFEKVLMVVGAGRGPLVRASLQVCSVAVSVTSIKQCEKMSLWILLWNRQLKKLGANWKFLQWRKTQMLSSPFTYVYV